MKKDSILTGILVSLGSIIISSIITWCIFLVFDIPLAYNLKYFLFAFVPAVILLRYYTKNLQLMTTSKSIMAVLFICLVGFLIFLVRSHEIL